MVIEVGLNKDQWLQKLDQGVKYLKRMCQEQDAKCLRFEKPLLLAILTIDKKDSENHDFQMGVFLCSRKNNNNNLGTVDPFFRMSLLWQDKTSDQEEASGMFGRMLTVTANYQEWRRRPDSHSWETKWLNNSNEYEYLSSNCCRIGESVRTLLHILVLVC